MYTYRITENPEQRDVLSMYILVSKYGRDEKIHTNSMSVQLSYQYIPVYKHQLFLFTFGQS